ncbi:MAG: TrmH family RNA methyltransferase [Candidatus Woesebacteria bacterium]|nr:TrmH family RNA methyltransferase [Candidatus Woesebacteria bacterium]
MQRKNMKFLRKNSKQLRKTPPKADDMKHIKRNPIYFVLDNVLDTYNIGSIFRLGDATAVEKIYICGENSEYPPSSRIHKAAVGTEEWVPWKKSNSVIQIINQLKSEGVQIIAIEQSPKSINYSLLTNHLHLPVALVVGHETTGISKEVLDLADIIVELPVYGINNSLNVWGSLAIITYKIIENY